MLALMYKEPGTVALDEVPEPTLPVGGLIVETAFVGVCGSDIRTWRHGNKRLTGPQVLGHEVAGTVIASDADEHSVGSRVAVCPGIPCMTCVVCQEGRHNLCPNRRVLAYDFPGGMAPRFAVPAEAVRVGGVVPIPEGLELHHAALAEPLHTVLNGQEQAAVGPRDTVLVLGLGPIGTLHTAVALSRGAGPVLGLDLNADRVATAAHALGDDAVAILSEADGVRSRSGKNGWDVVVLANGSPQAVELAFDVVAPGGRVLAFAGMPAAVAQVPIDINRLHYQQFSLVGAFAGSPRTFRDAIGWLSRTGLDLDRLVTHRRPLSEGPEAFAEVERGIGIKTVLEI